jgi:hypothetical protein
VAEILQVVLKISIMVFMVGNMAGMGAELAMGEGLAALLPRMSQLGSDLTDRSAVRDEAEGGC